HTLVQMAKVDRDLARKEQHYRNAEAALDRYLKSRKSHSREVAIFRFRALLKIELKRYSDAISDLNVALEAGADSELLALRGRLHLELNDFKGALDDFGKALDLNPKNGRAHNGRALALLRKPNPTPTEVAQAVGYAKRAQEGSPQTASLIYDTPRGDAHASARI